MSHFDTLQLVANRFKTIATFVAKNRVDSMAICTLDRTICRPGDVVKVERWYCHNGPTKIHVYPAIGSRSQRNWYCIPFSWVMEMGPDPLLASYMPYANKTWADILRFERKYPLEKHGLNKH